MPALAALDAFCWALGRCTPCSPLITFLDLFHWNFIGPGTVTMSSNQYTSNMLCGWRVRNTLGTFVENGTEAPCERPTMELNFTKFNTEPPFDVLTLYDGPDSNCKLQSTDSPHPSFFLLSLRPLCCDWNIYNIYICQSLRSNIHL